MTKRYINHLMSRDDPNKNLIDYWFCEYAKDAAYWVTRELADINVMRFNRGITIPSLFGGSYTIFDFQVEEFAADQFVIFAEAPFIVTERGTGNANPND